MGQPPPHVPSFGVSQPSKLGVDVGQLPAARHPVEGARDSLRPRLWRGAVHDSKGRVCGGVSARPASGQGVDVVTQARGRVHGHWTGGSRMRARLAKRGCVLASRAVSCTVLRAAHAHVHLRVGARAT